MTKTGDQFLHKHNSQFHKSREIEGVTGYLRQGGEKIPNEPAAKIGAYLGFLADPDYANDGILTGDADSIHRQIEAISVPLTKENAEANIKFQAKVARELGRGAEVELSKIDDDIKMDALRVVRKDQQLCLEEWVGELASSENKYPDWFRHWTFDQVKKLTVFNEEPGKNGKPKGFERRSNGSFALFPELDRASLSLVYDFLQEKLTGVPVETGHDFDYSPMRALLDEANFGKLYGEAQNYGFKITDELKEVTTGSWHDFIQSDHVDDADALSTLVRSYRTGWCTAGRETAQLQLQGGDFYVWCSTNPSTGKDEVPRIAVRMENGVVAEVRGVVGGKRQELEPTLIDTVAEKVKDLPGGQEYFKKADDMRRLTKLDYVLQENPETELSPSDVRFLYELDGPIQGFGYNRDPRIDELKAKRGERDKPEITRLLPEVLMEQAKTTYAAYRKVAELLGSVGKRSLFGRRRRLGGEIMSERSFAALLEKKDTEWRKTGVYGYIAKEFMESGGRPNLVATPNIIADWSQLKKLAEQFGVDQPYPTSVYEEIYRHYTDEQLSGSLQGTDPVRLSIIPSSYTKRLGQDTVAAQRAELAAMQQESPNLKARVPSVLDAIVYWYSSREARGGLNGDTWDLTRIRHFDLPEKVLGGWSQVPNSRVSYGEAGLGDVVAGYQVEARLAVG